MPFYKPKMPHLWPEAVVCPLGQTDACPSYPGWVTGLNVKSATWQAISGKGVAHLGDWGVQFKWVLGERAGKVISEWPEEVTLAAYVSISFPMSSLRLLAALSWPLLAPVLPCGQFSMIFYLVSAVEKYSSKNGFPISKQITSNEDKCDFSSIHSKHELLHN